MILVTGYLEYLLTIIPIFSVRSVLMLLACVAARAAAPENIVNAFYPSSLMSTIAGPALAGERTHSYVLADLRGDGSQQIVAAYSNGIYCAVRVLSPMGSGALLASAEPEQMTCRSAAVRLVDMNRSHRPLIVVTTEYSRGLPGTWIFRWTGPALVAVGPQDLADATFVDLDGKGTLSIIDRHTGLYTDDAGVQHASEDNRVFRYFDGDLQPAAKADYVGFFPTVEPASFVVADPGRERILVVVNGPDGTERGSSVAVKLNGRSIVDRNRFKKVGTLRLPVHVQADNAFDVTLSGKPGASIMLLVMPRQ